MSQKILVELELKKGKTVEDLGDIADGVNEIKDGAKDAEKGVGKFSLSLKNIGKVSGVVFLLEEAFKLLKDTLNKNQKVLDFFNTGVETLSLAFNDFFKFLDANVGTVIDYFKGIFENPLQSISDFGNAIYNNLINRFVQLGETLGLVGDAISLLFEGRFVEAQLKIKEAAIESIDVFTGVDNTLEKVADTVTKATNSIIDYTKRTIESAKGTVELNKQAEVAAVINQGLIEKYDRQAEQQRQLRDDETKTIEERIAANNKLGEVLEEQQKLMLENVDITIRAAQAEYDKNKNQENYIALLEAQNEREAVLAQIEGFRSEQIINRISLEKEQADAIKEGQEAEGERIRKEIELRQKNLDDAKQKAAEQKQLDRDVADAKLGAASNAFALIGELAGKGSKLAKTAAIAQATVAGIQSTVNAFQTGAASPITTVFPAYPFVQAGLAAGFAALNVAKIKSTNMSSGGGGGSAQPSAPAAPSFNVVGASDTNQLAQAIGQKEETPVKAYVVSNEVSNAQALDRNIVEGAAIG